LCESVDGVEISRVEYEAGKNTTNLR
jgi:hypothetical protein